MIGRQKDRKEEGSKEGRKGRKEKERKRKRRSRKGRGRGEKEERKKTEKKKETSIFNNKNNYDVLALCQALF